MATDTSSQLSAFLGALLGSSLVTAIINWFREHKHLREGRQVDFLTEQVSLLYGPLSFYAGQNECISQLNHENNKAYDVIYAQQTWSEDPMTQKSVGDETTKVIDLMNRYSRLMHENNDKIAHLIETYFWLADSDDIEAFQQFAINRVRNQNEFGDLGGTLPHRFQRHIGIAPFYELKFVQQVKSKCEAKVNLLRTSQQLLPTTLIRNRMQQKMSETK